jgi:signal transduction histidine kinase
MSLRTRLTALYTSLVGGILLLFGLAVYQVISVILMNQIDESLVSAYRKALVIYSPALVGAAPVNPSPLDFPADVMVQLWGRDGELRDAWPMRMNYGRPLDPLNNQAGSPIFRSLDVQGTHMRILTVPLRVGDYQVGSLQIGTSLAVLDTAQNVLLGVLLVGLIVSMTLVGLAGWFTTNQVLIPLEAATQTALQITRADDLSRRIPSHGLSENDEIGQLIAAFNQTLGRLEQLFNTQRRFLIDVGHELRTPLTVIKGNVDLMRRFGCGDEESLESIASEADRMTRLAGDLLLLSQAESGKLPLVMAVVELDSVVLEVLQQMRVVAKEQVRIRVAEIDQVQVCGDRDRLKQVFLNLVGNAVKYTPPGGEVNVSIGRDEQRARVVIQDTGPGIPEADLPHIFERFYRAEKSRTRMKDGSGFGLGLSIAYWIVRNHSGLIEAASRVGKGTTFTVWLPLLQGECIPAAKD